MNLPILAAQVTDTGSKMSIGDAAITALVGYGVVFTGILMLMIVLYITGSVFKKRDAKTSASKTDEVKTAPVATSAKSTALAPGSAGQVKLNGIPDRDAAMIMAIVAEKMDTPLNELKFISIKEVK